MSNMESLKKWKNKQGALLKLKQQQLARKQEADLQVNKNIEPAKEPDLPSIFNLSLEEIRDFVPKDCFNISSSRANYFLMLNLGLLITSAFTYRLFVRIPVVGLVMYWNIYGFLMWRLFIIGHDCVHNTFSKDSRDNKIIGRLCLTPLCMPFCAFQNEHNRHHLYVGHYKKDEGYGHPYFTAREFRALPEHMKIFFKFLAPLLGYGGYAFALCTRTTLRVLNRRSRSNDATATTNTIDTPIDIPLHEAQVDIASIALFLFISFTVGAGSSPRLFFNIYIGCFLIFSFWIFMASYMQRFQLYTKANRYYLNGENETKSNENEKKRKVGNRYNHTYRQPHLYDESAWKFETGALGVGEHEIGDGFDELQYNISKYSSIHHLFPNEIPHYNLERAHRALRQQTTKFSSRDTYHLKHHGLFNYIVNFVKSFYKFGYTKFQVNTVDKKALKDGRVAGIPIRLLPRKISETEKIFVEYERKHGVASILVRRVVSPQTLEKIAEALAEAKDEVRDSDSDEEYVPQKRKHVPRDSLHADAIGEHKMMGLGNNNSNGLGLSNREKELLKEEGPISLPTTDRKVDAGINRRKLKRTRSQIIGDIRTELDRERRSKSLKNVHFVSVTRHEYSRPYRLYVSSDRMSGMPWEKRARRREKKLLDSVKHDKTLAALKALSPGYASVQSRKEREREELRRLEEERKEVEMTEMLKKFLEPLTILEPYYL